MPGANFSAGDGHGVQGDGEVCVTALEMCLTGTFTFVLEKGGGARPVLKYPRAETTTHYISMGMHEDLDVAMKQALREMIAFIGSRTNLSRRAGLPDLQPGGGLPRDADGERREGRARHAEEGAAVLISVGGKQVGEEKHSLPNPSLAFCESGLAARRVPTHEK